MKKLVKTAAIVACGAAAVLPLAACSHDNVKIIPDPNPYSFTNAIRASAEYDSYMKIDGKLDDEKWNNVEWLHGKDEPNSVQSATIDFTSFVGEKGIFIGAKVEEKNCNIWVNPNRGSWTNSCLELYVGPVKQENNRAKTFEFDIQADGTTDNMRIKEPERDMHTTWDVMPVVAGQQIGGKVNTPECTGYTVECFIPWAYLELGGWDVSDPQNLKVGIEPVHIFSLRYEGEEVFANVTNTRIWSRWTEKVLPDIGWLAPDTFFRFDDGGLIYYDYKVNYTGDGKGSVETKSGFDFVYGWGKSDFTVRPRNGARVKSLKVNGEDYMSKLKDLNGTYEFSIDEPDDDVVIDVEFGF